MDIDISGVTIQIDGADEAQLEALTSTLGRLWVHHLQIVPPITVGDRPPRGGGGSAHSGMPGGPYIRLNRTCFQSEWNQHGYNYTLLHEMGHIVDWAFDCIRHMRREDLQGFRALIAHPHSGATQGWGEHYADGAADWYARKPMSEVRRNAILFSRGFFGPIGVGRPRSVAASRRRWRQREDITLGPNIGLQRSSLVRPQLGGSATSRLRGSGARS
ncbi:MAG: hypothetical protein JRK53_14510 [Deltaproteobacteria bacterium]|nr:hypothetical protein [Deltaproteobacteria bacterium]